MKSTVFTEQQRLSRILLEIYGAENLSDFRSRALSIVHELFGGELACHNEINLATGDSLSALSDPIEHFAQLRPAFFEHVEQHPSVQHHLAADGKEQRAVKSSDFITQRRWRGSGLYQEFYRPLADVRYQLTIGQRIDDWLVFFAVSRKYRDFKEHERDLLTMLRPHFIQAYKNARDRTRLHELSRGGAAESSRSIIDAEATPFNLMQRFGLSRREADALVELARGKSNVEIAETLGISGSTLKTRMERMFKKLNVKSRTAAVLRIFDAPAGTPQLDSGDD